MPSPEITGVVIFHFLQFELIKILMGSVMNHCPDRFAFMHKLEGVIDFIQCHRMGYKWLKVNIPLHGILDHTGELSAAFYSAKRGTFPYAPGDQLERTGGNLLSGPCDTNDNGLPPPTVSTFQRCTHDVNVTDTFKGMVNTPLVDIQQNIFNRFVIIIRLMQSVAPN
jgi:hypothetical protein